MFDKKRLFICGLCMAFLLIGIWGCNDSSTKTKVNPTVDPSIKGYPNGGLLAKQEHLFDAGVVIVDARSAEAYNAGHIPGAISMPWQQFSDSGLNLKPVPELETMLGAAGIKRDTWMIIYDDTTASWGAAGRLFWMLEYLGCPNVRILDGGWDKWAADGNETETIGASPGANCAVSVRRGANVRPAKRCPLPSHDPRCVARHGHARDGCRPFASCGPRRGTVRRTRSTAEDRAEGTHDADRGDAPARGSWTGERRWRDAKRGRTASHH